MELSIARERMTDEMLGELDRQRRALAALMDANDLAAVEAALEAWSFGFDDVEYIRAQELLRAKRSERRLRQEREDELRRLAQGGSDGVDIPALMRALESWPYDDAPPDEDVMRERIAAYEGLAVLVEHAVSTRHAGELMQALDRWAYAKEDPVFRTAIECLEGYDAELRVIRKALASRVPAELAAALAQLSFTPPEDDHDVAELRVLVAAAERELREAEPGGPDALTP
jgi:hypothetical protein